MVVLIGVSSAVCLAIVNVFLKKLSQKVSSRELAPLSFFLASITMLVFSLFYFYFKYSLRMVIILNEYLYSMQLQIISTIVQLKVAK